MPSHVTHALFAEEAWIRAFDKEPSADEYRWLVCGSGGPDPLFSGIRRQPSAGEWAYLMHDEGYGRMAAALAADAWESAADDAPALTAYVLGFCSHAILDRTTHPMVNYFSGWVNPADPSTAGYLFCHPFMERIIDMVVLGGQRGMELSSWRHSERRPSLDERIRILPGIWSKAAELAYREQAEGAAPDLAVAFENALRDDEDFMELIDPETGDIAGALAMERRGELPERVLGLFFPESIPAGDFLNEDGSGWIDPRRGGDKRRDSFMDLYAEALPEATEVMNQALEVIHGNAEPASLEKKLGNGDLNDPDPGGPGIPIVHCRPMEISPLIDELYDKAAEAERFD